MRLSEILSLERILVDPEGVLVRGKPEALRQLAKLIAPAVGFPTSELEDLLQERERLQSTGIGDGVAIPHTALDTAEAQAGALLLCPHGVDFEAIDGGKVNIIFGVVGPKRATGEHLRTLARISRLLRDEQTRSKLVSAKSAEDAYQLIEAHEAAAR